MKKNTQILLAAIVVIIIGFLWLNSNREQAAQPVATDQAAREAVVEINYSADEQERFDNVSFTEGQTALDLTRSVVDVETSGEGEMAFVTELGGAEADSQSQFWSLNINGVMAEVGAGSYVVQDGDEISWELASF